MENTYICFTALGKVELLERSMPTMGKGEMLVQTILTQVSIGTEMSILMKNNIEVDSGWDTYGNYPFDAGYINIGRVIKIGEGVDACWMGKMVASYGIHAKYIVTSVLESHIVPEGLNPEEAIFFVLSEIAMNGIRRAQVSWGDVVVVYGAGNVGQLTARYCAMAGAQLVFVVDLEDKRLSLLPKDKTFIPINSMKQNVEELILRENHGMKPDIVFEVTGFAGVIPEEAALLKNNGKLIILSSPRGKTYFDFHDLCNAKSIKIIGAHNSSHPISEEEQNPWTKKRNAELFFKMLENETLDIAPLITHKVSYRDAIATYEMLKNNPGVAEGIIFEWNPPLN